MNAYHLLDGAKRLASAQGSGRPRQSDLKRAISATYYALFHALALCCADIVATQARRGKPAWRQVYRALEHGHTKKQCMKRSVLVSFSHAWREFGAWFVYLQQIRHQADYDPDAKFARWEVLGHIGNTENIIDKMWKSPMKERREFAIFVLFQLRS